MRKEVALLWGRKAISEVSRCITSLKKITKTPNQKTPKIISERLQKGIRVDSALLGKRSAEFISEYFFWVPKGPRMSGQAAGER